MVILMQKIVLETIKVFHCLVVTRYPKLHLNVFDAENYAPWRQVRIQSWPLGDI